ncbi:hypothetical protein Bca4012_041383 [Brassica carinata]|uniref:Uncharacterized protein n=1 Tax=Brassica carinata TaxID=52824 RepID=A0A8X7QWR9_BRACI|nr:hypothetical protein Bca52824_060854 [Brassica carinata]
MQFCNLNSFRTKFILGFSVFLGLSIPQYFNEYTAIKGYGPVHTGARWALCFHIVKVLEFVAKKESLQLPHGFTALQVLLGNIREALQVICLCNCPTDELFYPGDKDTEAHELFGSYVSIITCSFKSQLIPFYRSSSRRRVNGEPLHRNIIITEKDDCYSFNKTMLQTLFIRHSIMIIETKADL